MSNSDSTIFIAAANFAKEEPVQVNKSGEESLKDTDKSDMVHICQTVLKAFLIIDTW